jgi:hypothetical protein
MSSLDVGEQMFRTKSVFGFVGILLFAAPLNAAEDEASKMKVGLWLLLLAIVAVLAGAARLASALGSGDDAETWI